MFLNMCKHNKINTQNFFKSFKLVFSCKKEYFEKLDTIVLDKSKFEEITINQKATHPVIRNETYIRNYLLQNVKDHVSKKVFDSIYPSVSQPGK